MPAHRATLLLGTSKLSIISGLDSSAEARRMGIFPIYTYQVREHRSQGDWMTVIQHVYVGRWNTFCMASKNVSSTLGIHGRMKEEAHLALPDGILLVNRSKHNDNSSSLHELRSQSMNSCCVGSFAGLRDLAIQKIYRAVTGSSAIHRCKGINALYYLFHSLTNFLGEMP